MYKCVSPSRLFSDSCKRVRISLKINEITSLCFHTHPHSFPGSPLFTALKQNIPGVYKAPNPGPTISPRQRAATVGNMSSTRPNATDCSTQDALEAPTTLAEILRASRQRIESPPTTPRLALVAQALLPVRIRFLALSASDTYSHDACAPKSRLAARKKARSRLASRSLLYFVSFSGRCNAYWNHCKEQTWRRNAKFAENLRSMEM
jgi:hypothetical protein